MMTVLRAGTAGELREEQVGAIRSIVERHRKVAAAMAAEATDGPSSPAP